jgi:GT2 family glycosyltransferase
MKKHQEETEIHIVTVPGVDLPPQICEEDFFLLIGAGDRLEEDAVQVYERYVQQHPQAELFYCDSDRIYISGGQKKYKDPQCKPDFDAYYLQSTDYIGGGYLVSGRIVQQLGRPEGLYDYLLRCTEIARQVIHVPWILHHSAADAPGQEQNHAEDKAEKEALQAHLKRCGIRAEVLRDKVSKARKVTYEYEATPLVSLLIPNKDHREDLEKCIGSIGRCAGYEPYEILIIENNSTSEEIFSYYETLQKQDAHVRVLTYEGSFHYSKINNFGAEQAKGEYLLLLNNDTEMISDGCLREMMNYARRPDVGAVGAQLLYGDGTIQHAGVILGYGGLAGHAFEGMRPEEAPRMVSCARTYSAVTAACMMVRRSLFEQLGGFDEALGVAYNDIDLCLRIGAAGYCVVYTPYAQLFHYESRTRGLELTDEKAERIRRESAFFKTRWAELLREGDPHYSPNLTLEKADFSLRR